MTSQQDIFNFKHYFEDFTSLTRYYHGLELYLRSALWIRYKYIYLPTEQDRIILDADLDKAENRKEYLDNLLDLFEPEAMIESWYQHYNPDRLTPDYLAYLMDKYAQHPGFLLNQLYRKYVDSTWDLKTPLWFSQDEFRVTPKPAEPAWTGEDLNQLSIPELKDLLRQQDRYFGCSKLRKQDLIKRILNK